MFLLLNLSFEIMWYLETSVLLCCLVLLLFFVFLGLKLIAPPESGVLERIASVFEFQTFGNSRSV